MVIVGSFEAKTHLPAFLKRISKGESIGISKRGVLIAELVPPKNKKQQDPKKTIQQIKELRKNITLGKLRLKDLIEEGRL